MSWCLDCHRNPAQVRPPEGSGLQHGVRRPADDPGLGERLVKEYKIAGGTSSQLLDLSPGKQLWIFPPSDRVWPAPRGASTGAASASSPTPPQFRDYLHREFPEQASQWNDPKGRREFLKLMSASLALAGVSACTQQPAEKIIPYVRQPETWFRAGRCSSRPRCRSTASPRRCWSKATRVIRPKSKAIHNIQPASAATDMFAQAAILDLYDPDRAADRPAPGRSPRLGRFPDGVQNGLAAQKGKQGAGLRFLTETITSPTVGEQIARSSRRIRRRSGTSGIRSPTPPAPRRRADAVRRDLPLRQGRRRRLARRRLPGVRPMSVRYSRDSPRAAARWTSNERRRGDAAMNRLYAIESTPS